MALFQRPPATPEELERSKPLDLAPDVVDRMDEKEWYARAFRGDAAQLTVRAVLTGAVLGFLLAASNVYVGLKAGWGLGVALTACIVSFSVWSTLVKAGIAKTPMTILENNCMQSTASAAGFATTPLLVSAIPAMLLLSVTEPNPRGTQLRWTLVGAWVLSVAALGVLMAIPMKRTLINRERLKFPSGTASAVLLQSLHSQGAEALVKARALLAAAICGMLVPLLKDLNLLRTVDDAGHPARTTLLPGASKIFDWLPHLPAEHLDPATHRLSRESYPLSAWNVMLDHSLVLVAAGAIIGLRVTLSMAFGGLVLVFALGPTGMGWEWTNAAGKVVTAVSRPGTAWRDVGVWFGAPLMVSYGLVTFALQYRTIGRAFAGMLRRGSDRGAEVAEQVEVPVAWFVMGTAIAGTVVVVLAWLAFDIPLHYGALAVFLTFLLALVAGRASGETDINPIGPLGKIMQLTYGALMPQSYSANLMTAAITSASAAQAVDALMDFKAGFLLGAHPRRQFVAQFLGIFSGTVGSVLCYFVLVPDATVMTGSPERPAQFVAPAAHQWAAVAEMFRVGIANLHPMAREGIAIGLLAGTVLAITEWVFPRQRGWIPSATGIGLGLLFPFFTSLSFALGAIGAWVFRRANERQAERFTVTIASGIIAGESLVGVFVAALNNFVLT
jgi:OPT family oligopeptide transporter